MGTQSGSLEDFFTDQNLGSLGPISGGVKKNLLVLPYRGSVIDS